MKNFTIFHISSAWTLTLKPVSVITYGKHFALMGSIFSGQFTTGCIGINFDIDYIKWKLDMATRPDSFGKEHAESGKYPSGCRVVVKWQS